MNLENYITELRDLATNLEDDVSTINEMADDLQELKDGIEGATDFHEIKEALEEFDISAVDCYVLLQPDYEPITDNLDLEAWKESYSARIMLGETPPEIVVEPEAKKGKKTKK